jgi:hypothetical protein
MKAYIRKTRSFGLAAVLLAAPLFSGCDPVSLTAASIGASTGISHTLGGIVYRTFTAPMSTVERATVRALKDMGIEVIGRETNEDGERVITASAKDREIQVSLEPLTKRTTRLRAMARDGILQDGATATEIVLQTERVLSVG